MPPPAPDWQLFRAFLAAMHTGSLSGAARMLGTTQPTMGRQVAALEAVLGTQLFVRSLEGLSPTDSAVRLLPMAEAMAAAAKACRSHGKVLGVAGISDLDLLKGYIGMGLGFINAGNDAGFILQAGSARAGQLRALQAG